MTTHLTLEELVSLVDDLGAGPIRDLGLLDSAAHRPSSSFLGRDAYPSLDAKAAALVESLVRNQALADGDTRLGWLAMAVFFALNGVDLDADDDTAGDVIIAITGGELDHAAIARQLAAWR